MNMRIYAHVHGALSYHVKVVLQFLFGRLFEILIVLVRYESFELYQLYYFLFVSSSIFLQFQGFLCSSSIAFGYALYS
jgi:hypothetical protein